MRMTAVSQLPQVMSSVLNINVRLLTSVECGAQNDRYQ